MNFQPLELSGAYLVEVARRADERGYFVREWCMTEFEKRGLCARIAQINAGFSPVPGTLRGMHFQVGADSEVKVVRCTRGAAFDVIVDLREESPTFCQTLGIELTEENGRVLYVPNGFAHGYQTLQEDTEVQYLTSMPYAPQSAHGVRFNDSRFGIKWPLEVTRISQQDCQWPDFGSDSPGFPVGVR